MTHTNSRTYATVLFGDLPDLPNAACIKHDPAIFFPYREMTHQQARRICASCPERLACLTWALEHPEIRDGIWGGSSARQRDAMRRTA